MRRIENEAGRRDICMLLYYSRRNVFKCRLLCQYEGGLQRKAIQSAAVHKMDAAGFSKAVVEQCRKEAKEDGYVSLDVSREQADENRARSFVTLKYKLYVPLLRIEKVCQIRSYANSVTEDEE